MPVINPYKHTEQAILNSSFDETTGTLVLQNVVRDSSGNLVFNTPVNDVQANQLLDRLEFGMITDKTKTLRVQLNPDLTSTVVVGTVSTVSSVTNTVRQGDLQTQRLNEAILDSAFINGITNNVAF